MEEIVRDDEYYNRTESPFTNHLILNQIEKYLPIDSLKNVRFMNKFWNLIFSRRLTLCFPDEDQFAEFLQFYSSSINQMELPFKNYKFQNSSGLWNNEFLIVSCLHQLMKECSVRKLHLQGIESFEVIKSALEEVASTLEFIEICQFCIPIDAIPEESSQSLLSNTNRLFCSRIENLKFIGHFPRLKHIAIDFRSEIYTQIQSHPFDPLFKNLLQSASVSLLELTLKQISLNAIKILLDKEVILPKLKTLNFLVKDNSVNENSGLIGELIKVVEKFKPDKILFYEITLTWKNFKDFFKIIALYNEDLEYLNDVKKTEYYNNLRIKSITSAFNKYHFGIPAKIALWHFPNLKKLTTWTNNYTIKSDFDFFSIHENMEYLIYHEYNCSNIFPINISLAFPNLKILNIKITSSKFANCFNLTPILSLKNLRELTYETDNNIRKYSSVVSDHALTGIPNDFILFNLRGKSYGYLRDFDVKTLPKREHIGISNFTELRVFNLHGDNGTFDLSLFFGFRLLPNLKTLSINFNNSLCLPENYMRIFLDDFPDLENLTLPGPNKKHSEGPIMKKIAAERPNLKINFHEQKTIFECFDSDSDFEFSEEEDEEGSDDEEDDSANDDSGSESD